MGYTSSLFTFILTIIKAHPGGSKIILKYAGKDATEAYEPIHPKGALDENLPIDKHLGALSQADIAARSKEKKPKTKDELRVEREQRSKPPISRMLSSRDLEASIPSALKWCSSDDCVGFRVWLAKSYLSKHCHIMRQQGMMKYVKLVFLESRTRY